MRSLLFASARFFSGHTLCFPTRSVPVPVLAVRGVPLLPFLVRTFNVSPLAASCLDISFPSVFCRVPFSWIVIICFLSCFDPLCLFLSCSHAAFSHLLFVSLLLSSPLLSSLIFSFLTPYPPSTCCSYVSSAVLFCFVRFCHAPLCSVPPHILCPAPFLGVRLSCHVMVVSCVPRLSRCSVRWFALSFYLTSVMFIHVRVCLFALVPIMLVLVCLACVLPYYVSSAHALLICVSITLLPFLDIALPLSAYFCDMIASACLVRSCLVLPCLALRCLSLSWLVLSRLGL